jgi:hypothetical protein
VWGFTDGAGGSWQQAATSNLNKTAWTSVRHLWSPKVRDLPTTQALDPGSVLE